MAGSTKEIGEVTGIISMKVINEYTLIYKTLFMYN